MKNFNERYQSVFDIVCRCLGDNWRINLLDNDNYRIKITSNRFMGFSIHVREEKNRFTIMGSFDSRIHRGKIYTCTVSKDRNPVHIAEDIKRKIIAFAQNEISEAKESAAKEQEKKANDLIVNGMLSRLFTMHKSWQSGVIGSFKTDNGLDGMIRKTGSGYKIEIDRLSVDNLIKLAGMITTLERG
ncbi:hypothetical protein AB7W84_19400 [Providencia rettgeri]